MKKQKTSEERLMELIDNPAIIQRVGKKNKKNKIDKYFNFSFFTKENLIKNFTLANVNKLFFVLSVLASVVFIVSLNSNKLLYDKKFHSIAVVNPLLMEESNDKKRLLIDFNESRELSEERSLFSSKSSSSNDNNVVNKYADEIIDIDSISLVGVVWSGEQSQVMVEDKELRTTLILNVGDRIKNFVIKEILQDRVILSDGQIEYVIK